MMDVTLHTQQLVCQLRRFTQPILRELFDQVCGQLCKKADLDIWQHKAANESFTDLLKRMGLYDGANILWRAGLRGTTRWTADLEDDIYKLKQRAPNFSKLVHCALAACSKGLGVSWERAWTPTDFDFLHRYLVALHDWPFFADIDFVDHLTDKMLAHKSYNTMGSAIDDVLSIVCYDLVCEHVTEEALVAMETRPEGAFTAMSAWGPRPALALANSSPMVVAPAAMAPGNSFDGGMLPEASYATGGAIYRSRAGSRVSSRAGSRVSSRAGSRVNISAARPANTTSPATSIVKSIDLNNSPRVSPLPSAESHHSFDTPRHESTADLLEVYPHESVSNPPSVRGEGYV